MTSFSVEDVLAELLSRSLPDPSIEDQLRADNNSLRKQIQILEEQILSEQQKTEALKSQRQNNNIPLVPMTPRKESSSFKKIQMGLRDELWSTRVDALKQLSEVVLNDSSMAVLKEVAMLRPVIDCQLVDMRSGVVRQACETLQVCAKEFGKRFAPQVVFYLDNLLQGLFVTIKAISLACDECIRILFENTKALKCLPKVLAGIVDSHQNVRFRCTQYLGILLNQVTSPDDLPFNTVREINDKVQIAIQDSGLATRQAARESFARVKVLWPGQADDLYQRLPPTAQKYLSGSFTPPTSPTK